MTPIQEIQAERLLQIEVEGWSADHDDKHADAAMLTAATLYYLHAKNGAVKMRPDGAPVGWPWEAHWWKPKDRHRDLVRAGALCLAERERIKRHADHAYIGHVDHKLALIVAAMSA